MGLREDTIERMKVEGNFNMNHYCPPPCETACCIAGNICLAAGVQISDMSFSAIPRMARLLWAQHYGHEEANRLEFNWAWGSDIEEVTVQEAIAHINGAPPVVHGNYLDVDDYYET